MSAKTPAALIEFFRGFPQLLQAIAETVHQLARDRFLPNPFQLIVHQ
jgi:hypothetical protein